MSQVLDYSLARPAPADIVAAGYVGVMRYVAPIPSSPPIFGGSDDSAKVIFQAEYDALRAAGLQVGLNWEWYGNRAREGAAAGTADATEALRQANALGYTGAIYFSVDYDAGIADQPAINAYFTAVKEVGGERVKAAYGGYWPLSRLFDANLITYGWQTLAWSGGNREQRAHLYQNGTVALGGDVNDVLKSNWGGSMVPTGWTDDGNNTLTAPNGQIVQYGFRKKILSMPDFDPTNVPFGGEYPTPTGSRQDFLQFSFVYTTANEVIGYAPLGQELKDCQARPAGTAKLVIDETSIRAVLA